MSLTSLKLFKRLLTHKLESISLCKILPIFQQCNLLINKLRLYFSQLKKSSLAEQMVRMGRTVERPKDQVESFRRQAQSNENRHGRGCKTSATIFALPLVVVDCGNLIHPCSSVTLSGSKATHSINQSIVHSFIRSFIQSVSQSFIAHLFNL